jgi:hypothetical protein
MSGRADERGERRAALGLALAACGVAAWTMVHDACANAGVAAELGRQQRVAAALAGDGGALGAEPLAWSAFGVEVQLASDGYGLVAAPRAGSRQP